MSPILTVVLVLVAAAVAGALGFYLGGENRKRTAEAKIGSAEEEAKRIVNDAIKAAEQKRKETIIEAKDEAFKLKADADKEIKDRRAEISRQERRMDQKEEALDKRTAAMERKEEDLKKRGELVEARLDELEQLKLRQTDVLVRYGGDEFLLLVPHIRPGEHVIQRVREAAASARVEGYPELELSASVGGVCGVHPLTEAIRQADEKMYQNKAERKN